MIGPEEVEDSHEVVAEGSDEEFDELEDLENGTVVRSRAMQF